MEDSANFEEGTNGLEDYPHVVRGILELGEVNHTANSAPSSGTSSITLPDAYDGNDLSVHLIYQFYITDVVDEPELRISDETDRALLPAMSLVTSLGIVLGAALVRRD